MKQSALAMRAIVNLLNLSTLAGSQIALRSGAKCGAERAGMVLCTGSAIDGTFTVGNVVITGGYRVSTEVMAHEANHSSQWAAFGSGTFLAMWIGGEIYSSMYKAGPRSQCAAAASRGCFNPVEIAANPYQGGYWEH